MNSIRCLLECVERFIKFLNIHAYTETVMNGTCYCVSAGNAIKVIISNTLRFGVMNGLGKLVMIFAKMFIVATVVISSYFIIMFVYNVDDGIDSFYERMACPLVVSRRSNCLHFSAENQKISFSFFLCFLSLFE